MAPTTARKNQLGVAAKAIVLVLHLHPKDKVMKAYPNHTKDERTLEIVVSGRDVCQICCEHKSVVVFNHPPHGDVEAGFECWAIQCFVQVTIAGNKEDFFDQEVPVRVIAQEQQQPTAGNENVANNDNNNNNNDEEQGLTEELHRIVNETTTAGVGVQRNDMAMVRNLMVGAMIDNDNAPGPENILTANKNTDGIFGQWEQSGSCCRALAGGCHLKARIPSPPNIKPSLFKMLELFFFMGFVKDVIIPKTNMHLTVNGVHRGLSYGTGLWWICIWLLMLTLHHLDHVTFWSLLEINCFRGAPWQLTDLMS